eukprot:GHVU01217007.1.p1 GENE.GHVU01217007.1~~GHVU01217007.1.p1  ORF type:complete len:407 (-),score=49.23 GHVU01217007.1:1611-2831(-)
MRASAVREATTTTTQGDLGGVGCFSQCSTAVCFTATQFSSSLPRSVNSRPDSLHYPAGGSSPAGGVLETQTLLPYHDHDVSAAEGTRSIVQMSEMGCQTSGGAQKTVATQVVETSRKDCSTQVVVAKKTACTQVDKECRSFGTQAQFQSRTVGIQCSREKPPPPKVKSAGVQTESALVPMDAAREAVGVVETTARPCAMPEEAAAVESAAQLLCPPELLVPMDAPHEAVGVVQTTARPCVITEAAASVESAAQLLCPPELRDSEAQDCGESVTAGACGSQESRRSRQDALQRAITERGGMTQSPRKRKVREAASRGEKFRRISERLHGATGVRRDESSLENVEGVDQGRPQASDNTRREPRGKKKGTELRALLADFFSVSWLFLLMILASNDYPYIVEEQARIQWR